MSNKEKYRHEYKYLIDTAQKEVISRRLAPVLKLDKHAQAGGYMIRSLYLDDYLNTAYEEKDAGVLQRKKYRIRVYNCSDKSIKLERKKKFGAYIYKEAASLTRDEVYKILDGDYEFLLGWFAGSVTSATDKELLEATDEDLRIALLYCYRDTLGMLGTTFYLEFLPEGFEPDIGQAYHE